MSLEAAVIENTNAIRDLIAALANGVPTTAAQVAAVIDQAPAEAESKPETLAQMSGAQAEKALDGHANAPADQPTYQDAANAVTKLARTKGRDAAIKVLAQFNAKTLPNVQASDFQKVIDACTEAAQ